MYPFVLLPFRKIISNTYILIVNLNLTIAQRYRMHKSVIRLYFIEKTLLYFNI